MRRECDALPTRQSNGVFPATCCEIASLDAADSQLDRLLRANSDRHERSVGVADQVEVSEPAGLSIARVCEDGFFARAGRDTGVQEIAGHSRRPSRVTREAFRSPGDEADVAD